MLEYGKAFLEANDRIVEAMCRRMSPGAVKLAKRMAAKAHRREMEEDVGYDDEKI